MNANRNSAADAQQRAPLDLPDCKAGDFRRALPALIALVALGILLELGRQWTSALPTGWKLLFIPMVFAAFRGAFVGGFAAATLTTAYVGWHEYSTGGAPVATSLLTILLAAVVSFSLAWLVASLHRRWSRARADAERSRQELAMRESSYAALQDSRAEHQEIFDGVPAMIWFKDRDGNILRANKRAADSIGKRIDQVEGQSTWDLYPGQASDYQKDDQEVIRTGKPKLGIIERYEIPGGPDTWIRTDKIPLRNEKNEITGVIVFAVDITEQLAEQQRLKSMRDELEAAVRERTEALQRVIAELSRAEAEKKTMQQRLQRGEQRLQAILDHTPAIIYMKDKEGRYVLVNRRYEELFRQEVLGKTDYEMFPQEIAEAFRKNDQEVYETRQTVQAEELAPHPDGTLHPYLSLKFPVFDPHGDLMGICGISTDITDRKRAQEALRHSEARLRTMTDTIAAAAFIFQGDRLLDANPAAERITGYSKEELIGREFWMVIHPEFHETVRQRGLARQRGEKVEQNYDVKILRKDGGACWVNFCAGLIQYDGKPAVLGTAYDITELKRAQEGTLTRLRLEARIAEVSKTLLATSGQGKPLNNALEHLLQAADVSRVYVFENFLDSEKGLCMRQTHEICAPGVTPQIDNPVLLSLPYRPLFSRWEDNLADGQPIRGKVREMPYAERTLLESQDIKSILVIPIHSAGHWYGFIGFDDTRTERDWTENDIRLLQTAAEMIGAYLAREQTARELRNAKEAAEAANQAKSRFLANISHEIRTPITAVLMVAEAMRTQRGDRESQVRQSEMILRNGRHLLALVNDLLDLSLIEAGRVEIEIGEWSLFDVFADVEAVSAPLAGEKGLNFRTRYLSPVPTRIRTDRKRLTQALINLVNNAVKYTEEGFVEVRVSCDQSRRPPRLIIAVEDSGVGIEPADLERIFETFTQVRTVSQRASEGAGLGLSIARWIAGRLGGSLTVASEPGRGSTFTIDIPLEMPSAVPWLDPGEIPESSVMEDGAAPAAKIRVKGRVLLADDAEDARLMMESVLSTAGAEVVSVADGLQAVAAVTEPNDFDLILLDLRMPNMDGEQAVRELRRRGCNGAIIALTAHVAASDRGHIVAAGFDDVWSKPITLEQLLQRTAAYLPSGEPTTDDVDSIRAARFATIQRSFLASLPERISMLQKALKENDLAAAREELHKLKGTGGTCGFMDISHAAADFMNAVLAGTTTEFSAAMAKLEGVAAHAQSHTP